MRPYALGRKGTEHSLMLALVALRAGYGVQLVAAAVSGRLDGFPLFLAAAVVEATALVVWVARRRALSPGWIFVADAVFVAVTAVFCSPATGQWWTYPYAYVVVVGAGLALASAPLLVGSITPLTVAVSAGVPQPERPAVAVGLPVIAVMSWYVARTLRNYSDEVDAAREKAVEAAADLAAQQERAAHAELISERVLRLFDRLTGEHQVADPQLRGHVADQAVWLRRYLEGEDGPSTVRESLAAVITRARALGLEVVSDLADSPPLPAGSVAAMAGAVQEALANVVKHAGTRHAQVTARLLGGRLVVRVADDGCGFTRGHGPGFGLGQSIEGRIESAGGTVIIDSAPGRGVTVEIVLPLSPEMGTGAGTDASGAVRP
ncbi:ATP-binding protein [Nonomuraea sp. NPDC047529]|uniref:sensor histidine kinase n=1 Tax=Nonomuraea sp. NPDC047529 TaxID=3155623 RepID=UPI0033FDD338